jgi:hypothetical protein
MDELCALISRALRSTSEIPCGLAREIAAQRAPLLALRAGVTNRRACGVRATKIARKGRQETARIAKDS